MLIVLQDQASKDTITFSAVTAFDENYSGTVASNPVEDNTTISDHFFRDNDKFKISGVVSDWDFLNTIKQIAFGVDGYEDATVANQSLVRFVNGVLVGGSGTIPANKTQEAVKQKLIDIHRNGIFVSVLMYSNDNALLKTYLNCLITNLSFSDKPDNGYAIYPEIMLERVRVVNVKSESIAKGKIPKIQNMKDKVADSIAKGNQAKCSGQTVTKVDENGETIVENVKPTVAKGTNIVICNPTETEKTVLKTLGFYERLGIKLNDLVDVNQQLASVKRSLAVAVTREDVAEIQRLGKEENLLTVTKGYLESRSK